MTGFKIPNAVRTAPYSAPAKGGLFIDVTTANHGYVTAGFVGKNPDFERLKFQVIKGKQTYNYDLHPNMKPVQFPVNMGNGTYLFRIMERVEGNQYAQIRSAQRTVKLVNRFVPFTVPTIFCSYDTDGPCVRMARYIVADCNSDLEAVDMVSGWVASHVSYDYKKASLLASGTGYVPNPDDTFRSCTGVCFDYASTAAAMLRSLDVPCRVVTGNVNGTIYHSWISAFADNKWRLRDPTFASVLRAHGKNYSLSTYRYENRFIY